MEGGGGEEVEEGSADEEMRRSAKGSGLGRQSGLWQVPFRVSKFLDGGGGGNKNNPPICVICQWVLACLFCVVLSLLRSHFVVSMVNV